MKKTLILLSFLSLAAFPAFAQNSELGLMAGGAKAMKTAAGGKSDFQHGFEEISYGLLIDQSTIVKIKVGRKPLQEVGESVRRDRCCVLHLHPESARVAPGQTLF